MTWSDSVLFYSTAFQSSDRNNWQKGEFHHKTTMLVPKRTYSHYSFHLIFTHLACSILQISATTFRQPSKIQVTTFANDTKISEVTLVKIQFPRSWLIGTCFMYQSSFCLANNTSYTHLLNPCHFALQFLSKQTKTQASNLPYSQNTKSKMTIRIAVFSISAQRMTEKQSTFSSFYVCICGTCKKKKHKPQVA